MDAHDIAQSVRSAFREGTAAGLDRARIVDDYRNNYGAGNVGLRPAHALAALKGANRAECFESDGSQHILVTKRIDVSRPFTLLVELHRDDRNNLGLTGGWRLYSSAATSSSPLDLFADLIAQYGLPVRVGGARNGQLCGSPRRPRV